jgi:hypothetical protein
MLDKHCTSELHPQPVLYVRTNSICFCLLRPEFKVACTMETDSAVFNKDGHLNSRFLKVFIFFAVLGFELRAPLLLGRHSTT